jgi:hypothetical protein
VYIYSRVSPAAAAFPFPPVHPSSEAPRQTSSSEPARESKQGSCVAGRSVHGAQETSVGSGGGGGGGAAEAARRAEAAVGPVRGGDPRPGAEGARVAGHLRHAGAGGAGVRRRRAQAPRARRRHQLPRPGADGGGGGSSGERERERRGVRVVVGVGVVVFPAAGGPVAGPQPGAAGCGGGRRAVPAVRGPGGGGRRDAGAAALLAAQERGAAELLWVFVAVVVFVVVCGVRRAAARGPAARPEPGAAAGRDGDVIAAVQEANRLLS